MFLKILESNDTEFTPCEKLKNKLIYDVKGQDKQKVNIAAHYFSASMGDAMINLYSHDPSMMRLAQFVKLVDGAFDTMNSSQACSKESSAKKNRTYKMLKDGYGIHFTEQKAQLENFIDEVLNIIVLNKANKKKLDDNRQKKEMYVSEVED